jgi:hypothetical protein
MKEWVVYQSGHKLSRMGQRDYESWANKMQEEYSPKAWGELQAKYPLLAQGLTESQAAQFCRLANEETEET